MTDNKDGLTPITVGLLPWGQVIEDFLDSLHLSVEEFVSAVSGGWLFGYVDALATAAVRVVVICVSKESHRPERQIHVPTGAPIWLLPPTRGWCIARRMVADGQAWSVHGAIPAGSGIAGRLSARVAHHALPWLATPVGGLREVITAEGIDALLCQEYVDARLNLCLLAARRARIPVTATFQGGNASRTPVERLTRRLTVRRAGNLIVGSGREMARAQGAYRVSSERFSRVPNPIAIDEWPVGDRSAARAALGISPDAEVVAWHGRVDLYRKGLDILIAAWRRLVDDGRQQRLLLLVGDGEDAEDLRVQLATLSDDVRWHDHYVTDRAIIRQHLAAADVAVVPSRHEGFPVALLEAMASGRAVVATDVSGVADVAPRGERDGVVIVAPGDPSALAAGLSRVASDGILAARLGRSARIRAEHGFSSRAVGVLLSASLRSAIARCHALQVATEDAAW